MKIVSKIHQKSIKNQWKWGTWGRPGATLGVFGLMLVESDEFGPHFGWIFFTFSLQDGSWMNFGVDLGAKLGPSWGQVGIKIDKKRCQKKNEKKIASWRHLEGILKPSWSEEVKKNPIEAGQGMGSGEYEGLKTPQLWWGLGIWWGVQNTLPKGPANLSIYLSI